jgi:PKD repeat protein
LGIGVIAGLMLCAVLPVSAGAVVVRGSGGHFFGVTLRLGVTPAALPGARAPHAALSAPVAGSLDYNGGPVLHSTAPYLILWDPSSAIPPASRTVLTKYLTDTATDSGNATNVFSVLRQYTDSTGFADYKQTFSASQMIVDTTPYQAPAPAGCSTATTYCVTDLEIQSELTNLIKNHLLPTGIGLGAPIYFVITPQNVDVCGAAPLGCAADPTPGGFCGYHSDYVDPSNNTVLYATVPFVVFNGHPKGCQDDNTSAFQSPNNDPADGIADTLSHEVDESITDPLGNGWFNSITGSEAGDICAQYGPNDPTATPPTSLDAYGPTVGGSSAASGPNGFGTLFDQRINVGKYYTQTVWSNGDLNCQTNTSADPLLTPSFTSTPAAAGAAVTFDPTTTTTSSGDTISSVTWDFGDGSAPGFTVGDPVATHTFAQAGDHTVTQTIVDSVGNVATVSHTLTVHLQLTPAFATTPSVAQPGSPINFNAAGSSDPNPGASISSYSWNFGDGSAAGSGVAAQHAYSTAGTYLVTLSVTDSLGLTQTVSHQVTVAVAPTAVFTTSPARPGSGQAVSFDGSSSRAPGSSLIAYAWTFGDGGTGSAATPHHTYARPGSYTVTLHVANALGLLAAASHDLIVAKGDKILAVSARGTQISVKLDGPGVLTVGSHRYHVAHARTVRTVIRLSHSQLRRVARKHKLTLSVPVTFVPAAGDVQHRVAHTTVLA